LVFISLYNLQALLDEYLNIFFLTFKCVVLSLRLACFSVFQYVLVYFG